MPDVYGPFYFSGADVKVMIREVELTDLSYLQIVPQQPVIPVYSVFSDRPTVMLKGKYSVRGTIAFNLQFSQPFEHLIEYFDGKVVQKFGQNLYYIPDMYIILRSEARQQHRPIIKLEHVYVSGGTVNAVQDGNPLQDVYVFTALNMIRDDILES